MWCQALQSFTNDAVALCVCLGEGGVVSLELYAMVLRHTAAGTRSAVRKSGLDECGCPQLADPCLHDTGCPLPCQDSC